MLEDVLSSEDVARLKTLAESSSSDNSDVRIQVRRIGTLFKLVCDVTLGCTIG